MFEQGYILTGIRGHHRRRRVVVRIGVRRCGGDAAGERVDHVRVLIGVGLGGEPRRDGKARRDGGIRLELVHRVRADRGAEKRVGHFRRNDAVLLNGRERGGVRNLDELHRGRIAVVLRNPRLQRELADITERRDRGDLVLEVVPGAHRRVVGDDEAAYRRCAVVNRRGRDQRERNPLVARGQQTG